MTVFSKNRRNDPNELTPLFNVLMQSGFESVKAKIWGSYILWMNEAQWEGAVLFHKNRLGRQAYTFVTYERYWVWEGDGWSIYVNPESGSQMCVKETCTPEELFHIWTEFSHQIGFDRRPLRLIVWKNGVLSGREIQFDRLLEEEREKMLTLLLGDEDDIGGEITQKMLDHLDEEAYRSLTTASYRVGCGSLYVDFTKEEMDQLEELLS